MSAEELAEVPDEALDFSDLPEADAAWFAGADVIVPQAKERVTLQVDRDVLAYFRAQGRGYQSRMNAVLRAFVASRRRTG